jgi:hypothetical protein
MINVEQPQFVEGKSGRSGQKAVDQLRGVG